MADFFTSVLLSEKAWRVDRMNGLMEAAGAESRTLNALEADLFDALMREVAAIDRDLEARQRSQEAAMAEWQSLLKEVDELTGVIWLSASINPIDDDQMMEFVTRSLSPKISSRRVTVRS